MGEDEAKMLGYRNIDHFLTEAAAHPSPDKLKEFDRICGTPETVGREDDRLVSAFEEGDWEGLWAMAVVEGEQLTSDATRRVLGVWAARDRASR